MHATELSHERTLRITQNIREELSEPISTVSQIIASHSIISANGDQELEQDLVGSSVGFAITLIISIIGKRFPQLVENEISCLTNWGDSLIKGIMASKVNCNCNHCRQEKL